VNLYRIGVAALVLAVARPALAQEEGGAAVAYVDIQRAVRDTDDGRRAISALQEQLEARQSALDGTAEALRELTEQLEQDLVLMDAETRAERLSAYQEQLVAYQEQFLANQQELLNMEREATREIVGAMVAIVAEIAQERDISMVFEQTRSNIVWAPESLDLTTELVERYEARH
jgi:outer membrane protein